jgi:hypothetical protein
MPTASPIRISISHLSIASEPATLAELVDREAMAYREQGTAEGDFLAGQLERLAQLVRLTGAKTPQECHQTRKTGS